MTAIATLIGGPTLRLELDGTRLLTDPTFDRPRTYDGPVRLTKLTPPALPADQVGPIDLVLLSHDQHRDNLDVSGQAYLASVPTVLSTPTAGGRLPGVTGLEPWQRVELDGLTVTALPARHVPEGAEALSGPVTGFLLEPAGGPRVYVSGDNASIDVVQEIVDRIGPVDVAVLFVGAANVGRFGDEPVTLSADRALIAAGLLAAPVVVPVHAEGWAHFTESVADVEAAFAAAGESERLRVLVPGTPTSLLT